MIFNLTCVRKSSCHVIESADTISSVFFLKYNLSFYYRAIVSVFVSNFAIITVKLNHVLILQFECKEYCMDWSKRCR